MIKTTFCKSFVITSCCVFGVLNSNAQFAFTNSNSLIPTATHSGCAISVVDVNNDGLDDIVKMDQASSLVVEIQNTNGTYAHYPLGLITASAGTHVWGMAVSDVDHNGWKDVVTGTNGTLYLVKLSWTGSTIAKTTTTLSGSYFVQNITFGDMDNDGWVDLAVCDDVDYMKIYKNTAGTLNLQAPATAMINTNIYPGMTYAGDPYDSGNYGSVWLDFDNDGDLDLYIAHCRQSTSSSTDQRRRDRLFVNNGSNVYTESAGTYGIEVTDFRQTWTTSFGDMDNDGDFDIVTTCHAGGSNPSQILINDGTGHFTDGTTGSGYSTSFDAIESVVEDFDNDGYLDILISGPGLVMYHNNGDGTYTSVSSVFAGSMTPFLSFATGDLNHDGFIDLEASYGNVYNTPTGTADVLWLNNKNTNHFITFDLTGVASNHDAVGAKVIITGAFGTQVREVRAGETYGTSNSMQLHFGLGANTAITSATIEWPAGGTTTFGALAADQFVTAVEGGCTITGNVIPGPFAFCTAGSVTLNAPAGYTSYLWSNGATTPSITVSTTGSYNVKVTNAGGCTNLSPTVTTVLNPNETATVTSSGTNSCAGTLTLTSTPSSAYSWTGPAGFTATTQSINPLTTGTYSLTTTGLCQNWTAAPTVVTVLSSPNPTGTGASGPGPASFNLSASGPGGISWYTASTGGSSVGTGLSYTTPIISTTTTYYIDQTTTFAGTLAYTAQKYHTGASSYSGTTTNAADIFDVSAACTLQTVKVYSSVAGTREIQLLNSIGTVINSAIVTIPLDTSIVTLNFALTPGTGYMLTTNGTLNTTNFGSVAPRLMRSNSGVSYPYSIAGLLSITNSDQGPAYFYYFYDWKVQGASVVCTSSPRVPVIATVTTTAGITALSSNNGVQIYPNPATSEVNVTFENDMNSTTMVAITDVTGRLVRSWTVDKPTQGQTVQLNVSDMNAGSYFITIKNDTKELVQKLMLTK